MKKYKVAVCILTYFPELEKLMDTLLSAVKQKNISFQIIVSDDGSTENYFSEIKNCLDGMGFVDYKLMAFSENQGTVRNMAQAVLAADAEYIRGLGPGDSLATDTILAEWVEHLEKSKKLWSFANARYYSADEQGKRIFSSYHANPQLIDVYSQHNDLICRWNYVVLNDIALGAATLCNCDLMLRYLQEIVGKVKYAEDNIYRLMMFDGYVPEYFPQDTVLYEFGSGVSTSGNEIWKKRLEDDWNATNCMILSRQAEEPLQKKMQEVMMRRGAPGTIQYKLRQWVEKGRIRLILKRRFNVRRTNC